MTIKRRPSLLAFLVFAVVVTMALVAWRVVETGVDRQEHPLATHNGDMPAPSEQSEDYSLAET